MAGTKAGRPFVYQSEGERPRTVSVRIPRELYDQLDRQVKQRRSTMSEALLEGMRLWLDTPADPRELLSSNSSNTVMQEIQAMVEEVVERVLAKRQTTQPPAPTPPTQAPAPPREEIPSYNGPTGIHGRGSMRRRILTLLQGHPEGLTGNHIRAYLDTDKPLNNTLQGMRRARVVRFEGSGIKMRYWVG